METRKETSHDLKENVSTVQKCCCRSCLMLLLNPRSKKFRAGPLMVVPFLVWLSGWVGLAEGWGASDRVGGGVWLGEMAGYATIN